MGGAASSKKRPPPHQPSFVPPEESKNVVRHIDFDDGSDGEDNVELQRYEVSAKRYFCVAPGPEPVQHKILTRSSTQPHASSSSPGPHLGIRWILTPFSHRAYLPALSIELSLSRTKIELQLVLNQNLLFTY